MHVPYEGDVEGLHRLTRLLVRRVAPQGDRFAPVPMRVFDMTAGLLLVSEAGGVATDLKGHPLDGLECTLDTRTTLLCAPDRERHALALQTFLD